MSKSAHPLADLARLLLLIVLLPLLILLAGPLLAASAIVGSISVLGAITLAPGKRLRWGRWWALIIGLLLWFFTWSGVAWLWLNYASPLPLNVVAPTTQAFQAAPSPTGEQSATGVAPPTPTATIVIATDTPTPGATSSPPTAPSHTSTPPSPPTSTALAATSPALSSTAISIVAPTPPAALTPESASGDEDSTAVGGRRPAIAFSDDKAAAFEAIATANNLLVAAIEEPTADNLAALGSVWRGRALDRVGRFAQMVNQKYQPPLQVSYSIVGLPRLISDTTSPDLFVQNREFWVFEAADKKREALSEYEYTLQQQDGEWVITFYQFQNVPLPTNPNAITGTEVITF